MTDYRIHGDTGEREVVIGLEVHALSVSNAKLSWAKAIEERAGYSAKAERWW